METQSTKRLAIEAIESSAAALKELSSGIWRRPELAFEEEHAHALLTQFLEDRGFQVERRFGLSTAFRATSGVREEGGGNVAVICEYDALPGIGHACGHNLIAEAGVAAGLGIQAAIQASPALHGSSVTVLGCPAEEGEGGKIKMIEQGCFSGIDCALMVHPFTENAVSINALARSYLRVTFSTPSSTSEPSSTNAPSSTSEPSSTNAPSLTSDGTNTADPQSRVRCEIPASPLDAAVLAYTSLSMLRQQIKPTWLIHGIISDGGSHPNVRPTSSELLYYFRAPTHAELETLQQKAYACFESAAEAASCTVSIAEKAKTYKDIISNTILARLFLQNTRELGLSYRESTRNFSASTDMGNVSHIVPSIHPVYSIGTSAVNHTRAYTEATNTDTAHRDTLLAASAVAMTGVDVLCDPQLLGQVKKDLSRLPSYTSLFLIS